MNAASWLKLVGLSLVVTAASCRVAPMATSGPGMASDPPAAMQDLSGSLRVSVRWPSRRVQYLPSIAESLVITVYPDGSSTPLTTRTINRSGDVGTATLTRLPTGAVRVTAVAKDASGKTVAHSETTLSLRPNALSEARLSLQPSEPLAITKIGSRTDTTGVIQDGSSNGIPGDGCSLFVDGTGFAYEDQASYSFTVGEPPTTPLYSYRLYPHRFVLGIPRGSHGGPVRVQMGPYSAISSQSFIEIASVSISPDSCTVAPGGTFTFQVQAFDASGSPVANPTVRWFMENQRCIGNICEDGDSAKVNNGLLTGEWDVGNFNVSTGKYTDPPGTKVAWGHVVVGNTYVRASASVTVVIP